MNPKNPISISVKWLMALLVTAIIVVVGIWQINVFLNSNNQVTTNTAYSTSTVTSSAETEVELVYLVHWTWEEQLAGLQGYLDEYTQLYPNISFDVKVIPYNEYPQKLSLLHDTDSFGDIYQVYSSWGVELVNEGVLAAPPTQVVNDVQQNYLSTAGVTINEQIWGIPSEINTYALVYDKSVFRKAGLLDDQNKIPEITTWDQLISISQKLTKKNNKGIITQYGIAFELSEDWGVVDPFLSLMWSNGGEYLSEDFSETLLNSPAAIEAIQKMSAPFRNGTTDIEGNIFDFGKGNVAMVIAPPWLESTFKENFGERYEQDLGVIPLPKLKSQTALQYSWFAGVLERSTHKQKAWDFLTWFTAEIQPETNTTRYGDLLANVIGAIPARTIDAENHPDALQSNFKKVFVAQLENSTPEPNVLNSARIKKVLMEKIPAVWVGEKSPQQALLEAKIAIDKILSENY